MKNMRPNGQLGVADSERLRKNKTRMEQQHDDVSHSHDTTKKRRRRRATRRYLPHGGMSEMQALALADVINNNQDSSPPRSIRATALPPNRTEGCWRVEAFHVGLQRRICFSKATDWPSILQAWGISPMV